MQDCLLMPKRQCQSTEGTVPYPYLSAKSHLSARQGIFALDAILTSFYRLSNGVNSSLQFWIKLQ